MASSGPNSPGTVVSVTDIMLMDWSNPSNAAASDNAYATSAVFMGMNSEYLKATNFGFAISAGATVNGIVAEIEKKSDSASVDDGAVRIVKGGTIGSTDKSSVSAWGAADAYSTYGASNDLWGETWTVDDINASTFGVAIQASTTGMDNAYVDHIRITVHYTAAAGGGAAVATASFSQRRV